MTLVSLADSCRQLSIDPKTLRRWLAQAPFTLQPHPHDARRTGLTEEQLRWLAQAHHRCLPSLPQEPFQPALAPSAQAPTLPGDLCEVLVVLRVLPAQLAALQEQLADLTHQLSHLSGPATTTHSRSGATPKATSSRRSRGRAKSLRQPQRPSSVQVLALVEYAGEGRYVVISPGGGLLPFEPESPAWFAWLTTCSSFRFVGKLGRMTAHRELHNVSRAVWRAHRKIRNHTYNLRLGKTDDLTIAALEQAAAALHAHL
jgi:septal ring-binding cell division protein DamX